jgi:pimeloyl-ACP methyl ester carboxylesterase
MPSAVVNGITLNFDVYGAGPPVVFIAGSSTMGRTWTPHQVPALTAAGYQAITIDNRGIPPSDTPAEEFTIDDMAADTLGLIEFLGISGCGVVGFSLGAMIAQELLLIAQPGQIAQAVLMATRGRTDALRAAMAKAERELLASDIALPPSYAAVVRATQYLSPRTLNDDQEVRDWLDVFEMSLPDSATVRAHQGIEVLGNRLEDYRKIRSRCLVIGFGDDLIAPPHMGRELADYIPGCKYEELADCGHYGYLEEPDTVNKLITSFFTETPGGTRADDQL